MFVESLQFEDIDDFDALDGERALGEPLSAVGEDL